MRRAALFGFGLVGLLGFHSSATASPSSPDSIESAETAVKQLRSGDIRAAAVTTRQAVEAEPGSPLLHNLAAAILMLSGDRAGAESEWTAVFQDTPGDSLALYGLGLASLQKGNRARALDQIQVAEQSGDRACCMIAERYLQALNGAAGAGAGLPMPEPYAASALGLSGMAAMKSSDYRRALNDLAAALTTLPGDPYAEAQSLVMTFATAEPIVTGFPSLPTGNGLAGHAAPAKQKAYTGTITLAPDNVDSDTGFVSFKVDGQTSSIANARPFSLVLNTARIPNGTHKIEVIVYDRQGQESNRATKIIRTSNAHAPGSQSSESSRVEQIRQALWQALILRPSRHTLAWTAAQAARASGNKQAAEQYLEQAAAIEPNYGGVRQKWAELTGCGPASAALWRGDPADNVVALTFDDGPKRGITEMLLSVLKQEKVPGTFFVIGRHATENPDLVRMMADAGMEIEDHTYTHPNLTLIPEAAVERELVRTMATVTAASGKRMRYFRPPGGNLNGEVSRIAAQWGLTPCMWTVDGESLENGTGDALVEFVLKRTKPGAIILLHNGRTATIEALPRIIAGLRQRGLGFVTVEQLAQRKMAQAVKSAN